MVYLFDRDEITNESWNLKFKIFEAFFSCLKFFNNKNIKVQRYTHLDQTLLYLTMLPENDQSGK